MVPTEISASSGRKTQTVNQVVENPTHIDFTPPLISCLAIIAKLLGRQVSVASILTGIPQGMAHSPDNCIRAAETIGLTAKTFHRPTISKFNKLTLPCILLLQDGNAAILQKIENNSATVITPEDPDTQVKVKLEDLQQQYSGYAIFVHFDGNLDERASDIRLHDTKRWFWGTIFKFWPIYKHVIMATLTVNLLAIASPLFTKNVYDRVVPNNAYDTLWVLASGVMIAIVFDYILKNLRGYFVDIAGKNADIIIANKLMQHLMSIRLDQKPDSTGSLANNLREFESLREFFSSTTLLALIDIPFIAFFLAIVAYIAPPLVWPPLVAIPIIILIGFFIQTPFRRCIEDGYREATQKHALMYEIISGLEAIKTSLAAGSLQHRWEQIVAMSAKSSVRIRALTTFSLSTSQFFAQLVYVTTIIWGVYLIGEGELTMGGLIASSILIGRAMAPLGAIAAMLTRLQHSNVALKTLDLLMRIPSEQNNEASFVEQSQLLNSITFDDVYFQYPQADTMALNNISLAIAPGEKVAIIGRIGSGKSTLGRMILRLYEPQQGAVKIGNVDIRQLDVTDLRRKIGYCAQDGILFYGTIRDNIAFGNPFADDKSIVRAAHLAGALEFIQSHPAGFARQVGEGGKNLSGGQRQAISIARTLLQQADILVLDEPTNSMDNSTETFFRQRLAESSRNQTLILITHRSSMLALVDRLIVLDNGRIVADGPKAAVLQALQNKEVRTA